MNKLLLGIIILTLTNCGSGLGEQKKNKSNAPRLELNLSQAKNISKLPLSCIDVEFPNKLNQVISSNNELLPPSNLHPAFYGCFDWHSAVHGHWSLVKLAKQFPELNKNDTIINQLLRHISAENIAMEIAYFERESSNSFERMYGWAWLFKLAEEINTWDHPKSEQLGENLAPLTKLIAEKTIRFLPKLKYAIRVGTHTNTAFALSMAYDFAIEFTNDDLRNEISKASKRFYLEDKECPISWEPSGYDFLSPCLEEANLMRRVLSEKEFRTWLGKFLPELSKDDYTLSPGIVSDRKDGHLVHLDGLNFSRAWCMYGIAKTLPEYAHLIPIANAHIEHSLPNLVGDSYEGGHWLASFALLAFDD